MCVSVHKNKTDNARKYSCQNVNSGFSSKKARIYISVLDLLSPFLSPPLNLIVSLSHSHTNIYTCAHVLTHK